jgi:hypothetical protein
MKIGNCNSTGIGSVPFAERKKAVDFVTAYFDIPFWPQLPKTGPNETMYMQFSENLPGIVFENDRLFVNIDEFEKNAESFFGKVVSKDLEKIRMSQDYAKGFYELLSCGKRFQAVKGQITGPISFGLQVCDQNRKPVLYNEMFMDALVKSLIMNARFQIEKLKQISDNVVMFLDEPFMSAFGSAMVSLSREQAVSYLNDIFNNIECFKGVHCCSNTDWSVLFNTNIDILSFDCYNYFDNFLIYSDNIKYFLEKGKFIAWGIVPTNKEDLEKESVQGLSAKLNSQIEKLSEKTSIQKEKILKQSIITPSCGAGSLDEDSAVRIFQFVKELSQKMKENIKEGI